MVLKLYFDFASQPSRALYIFLKTCNIPFEQNILRISYGENQSEEFSEINPFNKLPAIEHDGFKLIESIGISRYLCREFKVPDHWYPNSSKGQARVDEYLEWQHLNTRVLCSRYFISKVMFPMMRQKAPREEKVKKYYNDMVNIIDQVESKWLRDQAFLTGNEISIADLFAACEMEQTRLAGYDPRNGRPKLASWFERVAQRTAPHYNEANKYINTAIARFNGRPPHTCSIGEIFP